MRPSCAPFDPSSSWLPDVWVVGGGGWVSNGGGRPARRTAPAPTPGRPCLFLARARAPSLRDPALSCNARRSPRCRDTIIRGPVCTDSRERVRERVWWSAGQRVSLAGCVCVTKKKALGVHTCARPRRAQRPSAGIDGMCVCVRSCVVSRVVPSGPPHTCSTFREKKRGAGA